MSPSRRSRPASFRRLALPVSIGCAIGFALAGAAPAQQTMPPVTTSTATITYDAYHIPHIKSPSDAGAFHALGYAQMLDFPVSTLVNLWSSTGELSKAIGPRGRYEDIDAIRWNLAAVAAEHEAAMPAPLLAMLKAYVSGVNAGRAWWRTHPSAVAALVNNHTNTSNLYANPLTGAPALSVADLNHLFASDTGVPPGHEMAITVKHVLSSLLRFNRSLSTTLPASNGWLVGPGATGGISGGSGLLTLSDAHLPVNDILWRGYFVEVSSPGYQVAGWTVPGWPFVAIGFNPQVSWSITAIPPRYPATLGTWYASYKPGDPNFIVVDGVDHAITRSVVPWSFWNGTTIVTATNPNLPLGAIRVAFLQPEPGMSPPRPYPVLRDGYAPGAPMPPCVPAHDILFQQSTAMTAGIDASGTYQSSGSLFEHFVRLGQTTHIGGGAGGTDEVFAKGLYVLGTGTNVLLGDASGRMQYVRLTRVARQGPLAAARVPGPDGRFPWEKPMDGSTLGNRWQGTYSFTDLPRRTSSNAASSIWVCNNVTPDRVFGPNAPPLGSYPPAIWDGETAETWRQLRAEDLLRAAPMSALRNESIATDQRDNWMAAMWPLFRAVATTHLAGNSAVKTFVKRMEQWMLEDVNAQITVGSGASIGGSGGPVVPGTFDANKHSRTAPYLTLLRGAYEDAIGPRATRAPCDGVPPENFLLGFDPLVQPATPAAFLADPAWRVNVGAMAQALEKTVAESFFDPTRGSVNGKLANWLFGGWTFPGNPTPAPWAGFPADWQDGVVRWGHVNMLVLTRLFLPPPAAPQGNPFFTVYFNAAFGQWLPFLPPERVEVFPLGGTKNSLYVAFNDKADAQPVGAAGDNTMVDVSPYFDYPKPPVAGSLAEVANTPQDGSTNQVPFVIDTGAKTYSGGVHPFRGENVYFVPDSFGSRTVLAVEMPGPSDVGGPRGRFLAAAGGTEITAAIPSLVADDGQALLDGTEHYRTSQDFADRIFRDLGTSFGSIPGPTKTLTLTIAVSP